MVVTVVVTGMPRLMSLKDLAVELNDVLEGEELGDFRIRDIVTNNKTAKRQVALDFESGFDAMTVQQKLDGFEFITSGGSCQVIMARILTSNVEEEPIPCTEVVISTTSKPDYFECEHDPLEMRIDLLRKKTLALKAQRKFLREQKKLKKEYSSMDVDSDSNTTKKRRKRKRKKSPNSDSSGNDDRSKSHDKQSSTRSPDRNKKMKSQACEDYVAIEFKKISSSRKSMSPEVRKRSRSVARSESRDKPSRKSEAYSRKTRSRSPDKCRKSSSLRKSNSPSKDDRRRVRSRSRERRNPELHRTRSRSREKYYSVEMIQYRKSLVTRKRSPVSRGRYESTEQCVMRSKSSKLRRSPLPYNSSRHRMSPHRRDSPFDPRRRRTPRSKSRSSSPFKRKMRALENIDHRSSRFKNRSPSQELITTSKISSSKPDSCEMLENKRITSKSDKESKDRDVLIKSDAEIQSKKRQAMEDILFEMELLLRKEKNTISNADKAFLTNLVKGIIGTRFQKLDVHSRMMVSEVVTRYRSQYSREDDKALLRNLAGECKSLDASTSVMPAQQPDSTAEVVAPPPQNDDWLAAVDEVLDGVDLDLLQGETEINELESRENSKRESSNSDTEDTNTNSVRVTPKQDTTKVVKEKDKLKRGHLPDDINNSNEDITSSGITMTNSDNLIQNRTVDLAEVSSENTFNANCSKAFTDGISTKVENCEKKEPIELSDSSDNEINEQTNVTSTVTPEPTSDCLAGNIHFETENFQQSNITASIKKEKFATIDLTDDIELNDDEAKTDLPVTNLHNIKEDPDTTNNNDLTTESANIISCIKKEKIYTIDLIDDDDDTDTNDGSVVVRSIKQEKLATDDNLQNNESMSTPMILLSAIKQELDTTMNEVNSCSKQVENLLANTLTGFNFASIKQEFKASETNNENNIDNSNVSLNAVTSVPISHIKQEKKETTDINCHLETNGGSNDETNMPIPINSDCIKQECASTDSDTHNNASDINNISNINNDEISMPIPLVPSCIKQEVDTIITNSTSLTKETDINNDTDRINIPKPIITRSIKQETATVCDNVNPSEISEEKITLSSKKPKVNKFNYKENSVVSNNDTVHNVLTDTKDDKSNIPQPIIESIKKKVKKEHLADEIDLKSSRKKDRKRKHNDDCTPEAISKLPSKTKETLDRTGKSDGDKEKISKTDKVINNINNKMDKSGQSDIPIPTPMMETIKKEHKPRDKSNTKKDRKEKHKVNTPETSLSSSSKTKEKAEKTKRDNIGHYDQSSIPMPKIKYIKKEQNSADTKDRKRKHIDCTKETYLSSPNKTKERADRTQDYKSSSKKDRKEKHDVCTPETTHSRSYSKEKTDRTKCKDGEIISSDKKDLSRRTEVKSMNDITEKTVTDTVSSNTEQIAEVSERTFPANPKFVIPILVLMRSMKRLLKNEFKDHKYIFHILHKVLNNRFKELLKGKGYVKSKHIIKMYKDRYADEKREDFLNGIAADIDAGKYDQDIKNIVIKEQMNEVSKNKYVLQANK